MEVDSDNEDNDDDNKVFMDNINNFNFKCYLAIL